MASSPELFCPTFRTTSLSTGTFARPCLNPMRTAVNTSSGSRCSKRYGVAYQAYCLMPNHVHFIAVPRRPDSLARTFNQTRMRYSQHVNRRNRRSGHLWHGRFYSCALDEAHVYRAVRYVENNPVRARLAESAWQYEWSSAKFHTWDAHADRLYNSAGLAGITNWKLYLEEAEGRAWLDQFRKASHAGIPLGSTEFIGRIEAALGRSVTPKR